MGLLRNFKEIEKEEKEEIIKNKELKKYVDIEEFEKTLNELKEKSIIISDRMLLNSEKFTDNFQKKLEDLENQNSIFIKELKNSNFLNDFKKEIKRELENLQNQKFDNTQELNQRVNNAFIEFRNSYNLREAISWIICIFAILFTIINYIFIRFDLKELRENDRKYTREVNIIKNIMAEDDKFWYSKTDKKAYMSNIEEIKKLKEKEKKEQKK